MKLKNFLIESAYFLGMLIAMWLTVSSCAAHAQIRPSTPYNAKQRLVYMRGDTVFQRNSNGVEEPLLPPSVYQYHIDSLEAELYLYKPKPGVIIIELDTTSNKMVYRKKIGYVEITNLYDDSLWVTDSIFVTAGALNPINGLHVGESAKSWQWDAAKWEWENSIFGWVTDSIKWVSTDTTFGCDCKCEHEWVYSESYSITVRSVDLLYLKSNLVLVCVDGHHPRNSLNYLILKYDSHEPREHCPYEVNEREKICRKCLRSVIEREKWFQRYVAPPKSEFERLKEKQMDKR